MFLLHTSVNYTTGSNKTAISIHGHLEFVEASDPTKVDSRQETDWVSFNQVGVHVLFNPPPPNIDISSTHAMENVCLNLCSIFLIYHLKLK